MQGNERLTNHCLLETVKGKLVDEQTMQIVVFRLKREGYFGGLEKPSFQGTLYPDIYYSENINGGNPNKNLVLGNLEFEGDFDIEADNMPIDTSNGTFSSNNVSIIVKRRLSDERSLNANLNGQFVSQNGNRLQGVIVEDSSKPTFSGGFIAKLHE